MVKPKIFQPGEVEPWNMATIYLFSLSKLLDSKDQFRINGEFYSWCETSRLIYVRIIPKLEPDEKSEMNYLFDQAYPRIIFENRIPDRIMKPILTKELRVILDKIDIRLIELMYKHKFIFPNLDRIPGIYRQYMKYKLPMEDLDDSKN